MLSNSLCLESTLSLAFVFFLAVELVLNVSFSFLNVSFNSETADQADATCLVNHTGENLNNIISDIINKLKNINHTAHFQTRGSNTRNILNAAE
jgi:hypothetical protein